MIRCLTVGRTATTATTKVCPHIHSQDASEQFCSPVRVPAMQPHFDSRVASQIGMMCLWQGC